MAMIYRYAELRPDQLAERLAAQFGRYRPRVALAAASGGSRPAPARGGEP